MKIIPRAAWGPVRQARLEPIDWPPGPGVVHHTASATPPDEVSLRQVLSLVRGFDRQHFFANGWPGGIGYNYLVSPAGHVVEGRGRAHGDHSGPAGNRRPGIAVIGTYADEAPSERALAAVAELARHLELTALVGHRQVPGNATSCPGDALQAALPTLMADYPDPVAPWPPPFGDSLRLVLPAHPGSPFAGWGECIGPMRWIAVNGLRPDVTAAISWRGNVWRGPKAVAGVVRHLLNTYDL